MNILNLTDLDSCGSSGVQGANKKRMSGQAPLRVLLGGWIQRYNTPVKTSYGTWKWWEILRRKKLISSLKVIFGFYDQFRGCNHSDCCDFNFWRRIFLKQTHHLEWGSNIHIQVWTSRFDSLPGRRGIRWSYTGKLQHRCVLLLFFDQKNIGP